MNEELTRSPEVVDTLTLTCGGHHISVDLSKPLIDWRRGDVEAIGKMLTESLARAIASDLCKRDGHDWPPAGGLRVCVRCHLYEGTR